MGVQMYIWKQCEVNIMRHLLHVHGELMLPALSIHVISFTITSRLEPMLSIPINLLHRSPTPAGKSNVHRTTPSELSHCGATTALCMKFR